MATEFSLRDQPVRFRTYLGRFSGIDFLFSVFWGLLTSNILLAAYSLIFDADPHSSPYMHLDEPIVWIGAYQVVVFVVLTFLSMRTKDYRGENYHLADMPWGYRFWPWIGTLLLGPVGWIIILGSWMRLDVNRSIYEHRARRRRHLRDNEYEYDHRNPVHRAVVDLGLDPEIFGIRRTTTTVVTATTDSLPTYTNSPGVSSAHYQELRLGAADRGRQERLDYLRADIKEQTQLISDYGKTLKLARTRRNELQAEQAVLEAAKASDPTLTPEIISDEFERIMLLPGVLAAYVHDEAIRFIIRATFKYDDTTYDLGDWRIDIGPTTFRIIAREIRSGVRHDWYDRYPVYRNGDDTFCFGARRNEIEDHLQNGHYLAAMALAVECLNTVNPDHRYAVPEAFYAYKEAADETPADQPDTTELTDATTED